MEQFKNNETVVFLGDSITFNSRWISEIFEYYATYFKNSGIKIYTCGVPGGRAETGMFDLERNLLKFNPDRVIIMYGMNEINSPLYEDITPQTVDVIDSKRWHLARFYNDLTNIVNRLEGRKIKVGFCTNTPKDTNDIAEKCSCKNVNIGLKNAAEVTKKVAKEHGAEVVDFFTPMLEFVNSVRKINKNAAFIREDRTHPNDLGNSVMAKLFLLAQGFNNVVVPTAQNIADGSVFTPESPRMVKRREAEEEVQYMYACEWLALRDFREAPEEKRLAEAKRIFETSEDGLIKFLTQKYVENINKTEQNLKILKEITTALCS